MTLILVTPPAVEPVAREDVKAFLKLEHNDEDTLIDTLIAAARLHVEAATRRVLVGQEWRLVLDGWPSGRMVEIPLAPVKSVEAITVYDADGEPAVLDETDYVADLAAAPARILVRRAVPAGAAFNGIEVDFTAGYGPGAEDVPAPLRQAAMQLVTHWYEMREPVSFGGAPHAVPKSVDALIAPYRMLAL